MNRGLRGRRLKVVFAFSLLCGLSAAAGLHAQAKAPKASSPPSPPKISGTTSLSQARLALAKAVGTEAFPLWIDTYALALPLGDALTLYAEFIPKAPVARRAELAGTAAAFASLAGQWEDAANYYAYSAADSTFLLKSARCWLAAGKPDKAEIVLQKIGPATESAGSAGPAGSAETAAQKNLIQAWIHLFKGEPEKAFVLLKDNAVVPGKVQAKAQSGEDAAGAEVLFLLWTIANAADFASFKTPSTGFEAKALEARMAAECPDSPEMALVRRQCSLRPGNLLLEGLYGSGKNVPVAERSLTTTKLSGDAAQGGSGKNAPMQLQVGYFSKKENARSVLVALQKKGFQVTMEEQKTADGQLRWAVIVSSEGDWSKTQARLKDLGYESYLLP